MACSNPPTVTSLLGLAIPPAAPLRIRVSGLGGDCKNVIVTTGCTGPSKPVAVRPDGTWEVELDNNEQCRCGRQAISVHVECADDPPCYSESFLPLDCQECCDEVQIASPPLPCVPA